MSSMTSSKMQLVTTVVAVVFLLVGIAGFVPGLTTDLDTLELAGHESEAMLLGIFQVSILHNVLHLVYGVVGLAAARSWTVARAFLLVGGVGYAGLWVYGMAVDKDHEANVVPLNAADDWLHLGLAVAMIGLALLLSSERRGIGSDAPA